MQENGDGLNGKGNISSEFDDWSLSACFANFYRRGLAINNIKYFCLDNSHSFNQIITSAIFILKNYVMVLLFGLNHTIQRFQLKI